MNRSYRLVWNAVQQRYVAVPETARGRGKSARGQCVAAAIVAAAAFAAHAAPTGGSVSAGSGSIGQQGLTTTVTQTSPKLAVNWTSFGIAAGETVNFVQPNASAVALNRVLGSDPSQIYGRLNANGQVFLINPNGILFGPTSQVNVGGLVASTLQLSDADFLAGKHRFNGNGGSVTNLGNIEAAPGGYIAFLGGRVSNQGVVQARLGSVALAAGRQVTLDFAGDKLINVQVDQGALDALAENRQLIQADGGSVLLTAKAADRLASAVVNNTGVIQARTLQNNGGTIRLMGDMQVGHAQVDGTLDASAPSGGDGGFIETSAAQVHVADATRVTTLAPAGRNGTWLVDPKDFTVAASGGNISGATLSSNLEGGNFTLVSSAGTAGGSGDVNVNDAVTWSANTTLTLTASRHVNVNSVVKANGSGAGIAINPKTANGSGPNAEVADPSGAFNLGPAAHIDMPNVADGSTTALAIGGNAYKIVNSLGALQAIDNTSGYYAQGRNIDATATSGWNAGQGFAPIGTGSALVFDGLGHTITGLTINRPTTANVGLFGWLTTNSTVRNVGLLGGSVIGLSATGALVGQASGSAIQNSYASTAVTASQQFSPSFGGLVGIITDGTIDGCYATGSVNAPYEVGGLVGRVVQSTILRSYATGSISSPVAGQVGGLIGYSFGASTVSQSYASGQVGSVPGNGGGLVGVALSTTFNDTFWNVDVVTNGIGNIAGRGTNRGSPIGLTTAQMQQKSSFTNWDFANTWILYEGKTSPLLRSFMTPLTVTANNAAKTYDGLTYSGGNGVSYSAAPDGRLLGPVSYGGSAQAAVDAGGYAITPSGQYSNQQGYLIDYAPGTLTVNRAPLTITASDVAKTYGQAPTLAFMSGTLQNNETIGSVILTSAGAATTASVGSYAIAPSAATGGTFNPANYDISYVNGTLGVSPAALTVTANDAIKTYGQVPTLTFTPGVLQNNETIGSVTLISAGAATTANVGSYSITPSAATGGTFNPANYDISYVNGNLTVNRAALDIAASDATKTYGQTPTLTFTTGPLQNGETIGSVTLTSAGAAPTSNAGSYAIAPSAAAGSTFNSSNYDITYVNGTLTVNRAPLDIAASDAIKTYGQTPTLTFTTSPLQNNETISSVALTSAGAPATANAGSYATTAGGAAGSVGSTFNPGNYNISYVDGRLTVDPATLVLTADPVTRLYGSANPALTGTVSGFVNADTQASATTGPLSFSTAATPTSVIGRYAVTGGGLSANNGNYVFVQAPGNAHALSVTSSEAFGAALSAAQTAPTLAALTGPGLLDALPSGVRTSLVSIDPWAVESAGGQPRAAGGQGAIIVSTELERDPRRQTAVKGVPLMIVRGGLLLPEGVSVPR